MSPMRHVRKNILDLNQVEMAALCGCSQATVSKWENGELEPDRAQLALVRAAIDRRGIIWNDRYFFETPQSSAAE